MGRAIASDAELVEASRRGERAAFGELVERYQRLVCAVGYSNTRDHSLGEDIAQDTFVAAYHQLDQLRDVSRLREWLCGIARNLARKARRVREREDAIDDAAPDHAASPFDAASERERDTVVASALERVPETYREALVLYYVEGRSVPAVASALGISADAVHQRLSRGRQLVAGEVAEVVEHTLERRRSRKNIAAAVLAVLSAGAAMAPSHADASPASGGTNMWKIGIAAALVAALAGTGYAVHHAHAHRAASARPHETAAQAIGRARARVASAFAHPAHSTPAPPALPALAPAGSAHYDCHAAAENLAAITQSAGATLELEGSGGTFSLSLGSAAMALGSDQVSALFQALGSAVTFEAGSGSDVAIGSGSSSIQFIGLPVGSSGSGLAMGGGIDASDYEHACVTGHWSQEVIDCLAAAHDMWSGGFTCSSMLGASGSAAPPSEAAIAQVTDASCPTIAAHLASLIMPPIPPSFAVGSDLPPETAAVLGSAFRSILEQLPAQMSAQMSASCTDDEWSEDLRRCLAAATTAESALACN